jgi:hypothetical protein
MVAGIAGGPAAMASFRLAWCLAEEIGKPMSKTVW